MLKLNIGSGADWKLHKGFDGIDKVDFGQKYVADVLGKDGLARFKDNEFEEVMAKHFLEHFTNEEVKYILNQVHRILKKGGVFRVCVPDVKTHEWAYVLDHKTFWDKNSFRWLENKDMWSTYKVRRWKVVWLNVNERRDIHCYLRPIK